MTSELKNLSLAQLRESLAVHGLIIVPLVPTQAMLDSAWAAALAENAKGVWEEMVSVAAINPFEPALREAGIIK